MKRSLFICISLLICWIGKADEGMWIPKNLSGQNFERMCELGFSMDFDQLYDESTPSLKDAIVQLNIGCTGVSVSKDGLIFTNHHCGYNAIQSLSSVEHDYLTDGFVSYSFQEELPVEGMTIRYFVKLEDVTDKVMKDIDPNVSEEERLELSYKSLLELQEKMNEENEGMDIEIIAYYAQNKFYANYYQRFTDIRLVFAPPSSVGKFGGNTDNWMWPRQTGDFSVFRVYAGKDNKPADYSAENVPYNPVYVAPVSLEGYKEGDYTMIMGFPGSTNRYLSSWGVKQRMESSNAPRIEVRGLKQDIWQDEMYKSDAVRIKYSSKFQQSANYWKNSIGMNRGIEKMQVIPRKQALENEFRSWVSRNTDAYNKYGEALGLIESGYSTMSAFMKDITYLQEFISGVEVIRRAHSLEAILPTVNEENAQEVFDSSFSAFYKDYEYTLDEKVLAALLELLKDKVSPENLPSIYKEIQKKYKGDYAKYAASVYKNSVVPYPEKLKALLSDKKAVEKLKKDPAYQLAASFMQTFNGLGERGKEANMKIVKGERLFMAGLMEMNPEKNYPADANFTLRLTYGSVGGYQPFDGAWYDYYTTPKGILEKYNPEDPEFYVQPDLLALFAKNDFGQYANPDGSMFVNFLSSNDITGGNSGSPIFDRYGRVIGLAFDGNWEAMSGDIAFETDVQRTINVDIRYVLFIIDKWGKAQRLIDELEIK